MKKALLIIFAAALAFVLALAAAADAAIPKIEEYVVLAGTGGVNYERPDGVKARADVPFGSRIIVYNEIDEKYYVSFLDGGNERFAFITKKEMKNTFPPDEEFPSALAEKAPVPVNGTVEAGPGLNMRYGPHTNFVSRKLIPDGTKLTYEYSFGRWALVKYDGVSGWVSLTYLKTDAETDGTKNAVTEDAETAPPETETDGAESADTARDETGTDETEPPATEAEREETSAADGGTDSAEAARTEEPDETGSDAERTEAEQSGPTAAESDPPSSPDGTAAEPEESSSPTSVSGNELVLTVGIIVVGCVIAATVLSATALVIVILFIRSDKRKNANK